MKQSCSRAAAIIGFLLFTPACSGWVRAEAGFTTSTTLAKGRQGAAFGTDFGIGKADDPVAVNIALRGKVTKSVGDVALNLGLLHLHAADPVGFYVIGGVNFLQLGSADADVSFGMFSPVAQAGATIAVDDNASITIGTRIEYDLRFTSQPHEGFSTVNVGFAAY